MAHYLGLSKASVSIAVRQMREMGLVEAEADDNLLFTAEGKKRADLLTCRITFFRHALIRAGVDQFLALQDAISFSWEMSDVSYEAFRRMLPASADTPVNI